MRYPKLKMTTASAARLTAAAKRIWGAATHPNYNVRMKVRHINRYLIHKLTGAQRIAGLEIQHTYRCNARCSFCSMGDAVSSRKDMDPALFDRVLSEAKKEGIVLFTFLGGETFIDRNLFKYLDLCWDAGIRTEIQSNGTLLTEDLLLKLKQAHVQNVVVTLHGTTSQEHDGVYQVKGAFDRVMHAFAFARKIGLPMSMKTLYSKRTERDGTFYKILNLAKEQNVGLNVNPFMPVGNGFEDAERLDAAGAAKFRSIAAADSTVSSHIFNDGECTGCFAGKDYFCVTPEGDLLPCYFMPLSIGNIQTTRLREAHRRAMEIPIFAERFPICYVAESETFYQKCLVPLHKNYKKLPVNILEHPEVADLLKQFNMSNL